MSKPTPLCQSPRIRRFSSHVQSLVLFLVAVSWLSACGDSANAAPVCALTGEPIATLSSAEAAWAFVEKQQGTLQATKTSGEVRNIQFDHLPSDLDAIPARRIDLFLALVLPSALNVNAAITEDRNRLTELSQKSELGVDEKRSLRDLAERYGLESPSISELLERVDIIPPSLILAQAADESGWGRSRFAVEGNALFGQHTNDSGQPAIAAREGNVRLAAFKTLCGSVEAYVSNLNSTRAYAKLREIRVELRKAGKPLSGSALVAGLTQYSERGESYQADLRSIIRHHDLEAFDKAHLVGPSEWARVSQH